MEAKNRTFGVEIECYLPQSVRISVGGYHRGSQVSWLPAGWNAQSDSSLVAPTGYRAVEIVSPVLSGEDGITQVVTVVDILVAKGAIVNDNCGLHCHVGASDYTQVDVTKLVTLFRRYEKIFYALNGEQASRRWNNHYCRNSSNWVNPYASRYQSLNLVNLGTPKRTVEFRLFAGTLNVEIIVQAVFMCVGLVNKAKQIDRVKTPRTLPQTWREMMDKFNRVILKGNLVCDIEQDEAIEIVAEQALVSTVSL